MQLLPISATSYNCYVNYILLNSDKNDIEQSIRRNFEGDRKMMIGLLTLLNLYYKEPENNQFKFYTKNKNVLYTFIHYLAFSVCANKDKQIHNDNEIIEQLFEKSVNDEITENQYLLNANGIMKIQNLTKYLNKIKVGAPVVLEMKGKYLNVIYPEN